MKKLFFLLIGVSIYSQQVVINDRLLAQLQKNQIARVNSEKTFLSSYSKQKEIYDNAKKKVAQIVAIQEYIYNQLKNVNSVFRQGKQITYIWKEFNDIVNDSKVILSYNTKYPQYSVFLLKAYEEIWIRLIRIKSYIEQEALKEENDFIMDSYDRDKILIRISDELRGLRAGTYGIIMYFQRAKKTPYLLHIREIKSYVNVDKMIVQDIIRKTKYFKYH
ncbi:hypothetical protein [Riemerella anatipestifer]|uniref:Uncharacterized protein n=1 Tax=Riemerella anatipestifer TaxID=34085 RepID=A0AAP6HFZ0_RIEAN|nr:hypothetical protein [Riemerella anatipestifer]MCO7354033.1 hypothetical protein [Riemerella anatipestifer]MCU7559136.1 hypothetical protein [Riemerella anatipestifer]MCU7571133.1 hypothetical protein [Riemerella anatipestifer]MCU7597590.1 hypothetical protein [Riemerella anatipestifer]MCW0488333.1 hypothetical protein [Riemerella anatipestifer]